MGKGPAERWQLFISEASEASERLGEAMAKDPPDLDAATRAVFNLTTAAALSEIGELTKLGKAMRAALHTLPSGSRLLPERFGTILAEIAGRLPGIIRGLRDLGPGSIPDLAPLLQRIESEAMVHLPSGDPSGARREEEPPREPPRAVGPFVPLCDEDMVEPFIEETSERLEGLSQKLLVLEARPDDRDLINDIFRDLHTIKGSSGFVGLGAMNQLAHAAEDLVGQLRGGSRSCDRGTVDALLSALDGLRAILDMAVKRAPIQIELGPYLDRLRVPGTATDRAERSGLDEAPVERRSGDRMAEPSAQLSQRHTLRVDFDKLDLLLNLVGELVLSKSRLHGSMESLSGLARDMDGEIRKTQKMLAGHTPRFAERLKGWHHVLDKLVQLQIESAGHLDRVAADLREQVMKLRMVPLGRVFNKHHRTVRELGHSLGKRVRLHIEGAETELDKMLVEQLDEPLLHLLRNAIDHGFETPDRRAALGKPPEGLLKLTAQHRGNQIVIEISDDGAGIDPEVIRQRALSKGILLQEDTGGLDRQRLLEIIFHPGFSTKDRVSEISGRGVGMDVVQETVQRLKGSIEIDSEPGKGTSFLIRLPITLAIIQVLLVEVAGQAFALPLSSVQRSLKVDRREVRRMYDREVLLLDDPHGGAEVPLFDLGEVLKLPRRAARGAEVHLVLVEAAGGLYGMICDRQLGKREIVVKSLGELLEEVPCMAGATLIDDEVVLLLDLHQLVHYALRAPATRAQAATEAGPSSRPMRVLIAEDAALEREFLRRLLSDHGYEVVAAADGREALALALGDARGFDLLCTDITMPDLDGYELTRALRSNERHREIPIVMLTARSEPVDRIRGFESGVDEYLVKPMDPDQLLRVVRRLLEDHGRRAEKGAPQ